MPTRKIRDYEDINPKYKVCRHPEHKPPMHVVYEPGEWEHVCPGCGNVIKGDARMKPMSPVITGKEHLEVVLAKDQPEYQPLPVVYALDPADDLRQQTAAAVADCRTD